MNLDDCNKCGGGPCHGEHFCEHDFSNAIRKGRANYECPKCHEDISLEWYFMQEAIIKGGGDN